MTRDDAIDSTCRACNGVGWYSLWRRVCCDECAGSGLNLSALASFVASRPEGRSLLREALGDTEMRAMPEDFVHFVDHRWVHLPRPACGEDPPCTRVWVEHGDPE